MIATSLVRRDIHPLGSRELRRISSPDVRSKGNGKVMRVARRSSLPAAELAERANRQTVPAAPKAAVPDDDYSPSTSAYPYRDTDDLVTVASKPSRRLATKTGRPQPSKQQTCLGLVGKIIICLVVVWIASMIIIGICNRVNDVSNTFRYGPTRTFATTAVLNLHDSQANPSDIEVSNLRGTIIVAVIPGGDSSKVQVYNTGLRLIGDNADKTPAWVTTAKSANSDRPSIVIHIDGQNTTVTLVPNDKGGFTLSK